MQNELYCQVAVKYPGANATLTYQQGLPYKRGDLVHVPLGRRVAQGVVVSADLTFEQVQDEIKGLKIRPSGEVLSRVLRPSEEELKLFEWMAKYYHYNLGMLVWESLPKILKRPRACAIFYGQGLPLNHELNRDQRPVVEAISPQLGAGFERFFIHGVTGSGKTLIYLHLMIEALRKGQSVLFLLPEINLTPQFMKTFLAHLQVPVLAYHSGVTDSQKYGIWKHLKETEGPVVVMGVRSSVFLPLSRLGLVIVDEEHDSSFKQNDRCPYNGRDVAIKKAQLAGAVVVLGSATPSVENFYQFKDQSGHYFALRERVSGHFPQVEILDCRKSESREKSMAAESELNIWPFEKRSLEVLKEALEKKEQSLVFVNRLGFSQFLQCRSCGHRFTDPNTGVALRYFKKKNILSSSHSDYQIPRPEVCPECGNMNLLEQGFGTERLQEVLFQVFPDAVVDRFDRDEITNFKELDHKLNSFHRGEIDILVGTQMLSKGHNFERVNTVLILGTDSLMNFPDFRAIERTYQMITQILGRAGRYGKDSKVLIQTLIPEAKIFDHIREHQFHSAYEEELEVRKFAQFSPYSKMACLHFSSRFRERVAEVADAVARSLREFNSRQETVVDIMGPAPAMIERRLGQYNWVIVLKSPSASSLHQSIIFFEKNFMRPSGVNVKIDVDPYFTL